MDINKALMLTPDFFIERKQGVISLSSPQHFHEAFELCFYINVDLRIFIKDQAYEIHDGDLIFIPERELHRLVYEKDVENYTRYVINFKRSFIEPLTRAAGLEGILEEMTQAGNLRIKTSLAERKMMESLFEDLVEAENERKKRRREEKCEDEKNQEDAVIKSYLLVLLIRLQELFQKSLSIEKSGKRDLLVNNVSRYINTHLEERLTLDKLADQFHLDKYHIIHTFKAMTGYTIVEYIQIRRIMMAQKLLCKGDEQIIDIAFNCGFNSVQHFHRVFKGVTGITPGTYRKMMKYR